MSIAHWIVVIWLVLSAVVTVWSVGEQRKPITPGVAASSVVALFGLILLVVLG